ncbi:S41 family peptidase, partial [Nostoc sp.]|uniref:S41 family peptidase n=1 Tax=Nostoc sp. TaxID=1180 RepID=UPI002FFC31C4
GYVLDLRSDPGGLLDASLQIASMWLKEGAIVFLVNRDQVKDSYNASGHPLTNKPLVILVDKGSAMLPLDKLLDNFKNEYEWAQVQQQCSLATHLHRPQILLVINNIEEIVEGFSKLYNRILEMSRFILAIVKLSFLLGVSLLFLLLFGIIDLQRKFPDLSLPVIVSLAIWVLIALLELVLDTWFLYKNLYGSSSHYLRFFPNKKSPN